MTGELPAGHDERAQRLSAALRAQASGLAIAAPAPAPDGRTGRRVRSGLPAWAVLALAVLLGALAGGLAGAISAW
ncbi:MAG TPA: hypothetical protein VFQ77_00705 [Pseudonocardiaceae bacterium]|jgi:ABC-type uncharacterized transport system permease subunit|nr:hypothetical protein [Pseudonocardiaceae bacterium]